MKPKFKWAYKVVVESNKEGVYRSVYAGGQLRVDYQIGEESVAPVGGLLCFAKYEDAVEWARGFCRILKVRAYDPVPLYKRSGLPDHIGKARAARFWNPKTRSDEVKLCSYDWPRGTVAYRRIIPTKEMK